VSKSFSFLNRNTFTKTEIATDQFISLLRGNQHAQDWQLRQAENVVRLYVGAFKTGIETNILPGAMETAMIYMHVMRNMTNATKSPLDSMVLQSA